MWMADPSFMFEDKWIRNTRNHVAILRSSGTYRTRTNRTRKHRGWGDVSGKIYYRSYSTVVKHVSKFFNTPANAEYDVLLIELCSKVHTSVLYVHRSGNKDEDGGAPYTIYAFDPNETCNSQPMADVANLIQKNTDVYVWTSKNPNYDGVCFGLAWRFIYAVLNEDYDPIANEKIKCIFEMSSQRPIPYKRSRKDGAARRAAIGYRRKANSYEFEFIRR